jgi:hypothetical protein
MIMLSDRVLDGREDRPSFGGIDVRFAETHLDAKWTRSKRTL